MEHKETISLAWKCTFCWTFHRESLMVFQIVLIILYTNYFHSFGFSHFWLFECFDMCVSCRKSSWLYNTVLSMLFRTCDFVKAWSMVIIKLETKHCIWYAFVAFTGGTYVRMSCVCSWLRECSPLEEWFVQIPSEIWCFIIPDTFFTPQYRFLVC